MALPIIIGVCTVCMYMLVNHEWAGLEFWERGGARGLYIYTSVYVVCIRYGWI